MWGGRLQGKGKETQRETSRRVSAYYTLGVHPLRPSRGVRSQSCQDQGLEGTSNSQFPEGGRETEWCLSQGGGYFFFLMFRSPSVVDSAMRSAFVIASFFLVCPFLSPPAWSPPPPASATRSARLALFGFPLGTRAPSSQLPTALRRQMAAPVRYRDQITAEPVYGWTNSLTHCRASGRKEAEGRFKGALS